MGWRLDPGLPGETAFLYPPRWDQGFFSTWPSTRGVQSYSRVTWVPRYTKRIAEAITVVMVMQKKGWSVAMSTGGREWFALFWCDGDQLGHSFADTLPEAICLAAKKALEGSHE